LWPSIMADHTAATPAKNKGNQCFKKKDWNGAIQAYTDALRIDDQWGVLYSNRSQAYFNLKKYEESLGDANNCIKVRKDHVKGYHRAANALAAMKRYTEAMNILEKAYKQGFRTNKDLMKKDDEIRPMAKAQKDRETKSLPKLERLKAEGNKFFKESEYPKAITCYDKVIAGCVSKSKVAPLSADDKKLLISSYCNKAICLQQQSAFTEVIEVCNKALELEPYNVKALLRRSSAFEGIEKYRLALDDVRKALLSVPSNKVANKAQHRLSNAVRALKKAKKHM